MSTKDRGNEMAIGPELRVKIENLQRGNVLRRLKHFRSLGIGHVVRIDDDLTKIEYKTLKKYKCVPNKLKSVEISEMLEVRSGFKTDNFHRAIESNKFARQLQELLCFSIVFRHRVLLSKTVDFLCESREDRQNWVEVLQFLIAKHKMQVVHFNESAWLSTHFRNADLDGNKVLTFEEIWVLLSKLNLEISRQYAKEIFEKADIHKNDDKFGRPALDETEFLIFFRQLTHSPDLNRILCTHSELKQAFFTAQDFRNFLIYEQEYPIDYATLDLAKELIRKYEPDVNENKELLLGASGLRNFLLCEHGCAVDDSKHDMTQPLPHYFIYSSHNTYALGDQVRGSASIEGYIRALKAGAKLVELDVYDGPEETGDPIITHGHTMMKSVSFTQVVKAINDYAFCVSPYPVILSIENHCSIEGQKQMARIFKMVFAEKLHFFDPNSTDLPSPEELKGKILIKGKTLPGGQFLDVTDGDGNGSVTEDEEGDSEDEDGQEINIVTENNNTTVVSTDETDKYFSSARLKRHFHRKKKSLRLSAELSTITAIAAKKLTNICNDTDSHPVNAMVSVSESKFLKLSMVERDHLVGYTSRHLVKAYPKGLRTDSSNMNPMPAWMCGIQCMTLNLQTCDEETDLNSGLFLANRKCGYVLKPNFLTQPKMSLYELMGRPVQATLHVHLISGQYLPKSSTAQEGSDIIDPYVTIEIDGLPCDVTKVKSSVVRNNGFDPSWNQTFAFKLHGPEIAMLRFCVKDYDKTSYNDFVGSYSLPVKFIKQGFSLARLMTGSDHSLDPSAALLVKLAIE